MLSAWPGLELRAEHAHSHVLPAQVVVFTGLFKAIDVEDELAAVLGHEAGHVVARHIVRPPLVAA